MRRWTDYHGPDKLYDKFVVASKKHCVDDPGRAGVLIPDENRLDKGEEFVFVLRPETDFAAWTALLVYAGTVRSRSPNLAAAIEEHCDRIRGENEQ